MYRFGPLLVAIFVSLAATGCATAPQESADVEYYAPKIYRTGSNIPAKDYGAENIELRSGEILHPAARNPVCSFSTGIGCR